MRFTLLVLAALAAAPLTLAHDPPGLKNYCEPSGEWHTHDYMPISVHPEGPGASLEASVSAPDRTPALLAMDGNVLGDCSAGTNPGTPCYSVDVADPLATEVGVCDFDPPVADWDGHDEFALGGAVLLVETGSGEADPTAGSGSLYCYGGIGHHPAFGPFTVTDVVLGAGATFTVTSDRIDLLGLGDGCGDFKSDDSSDCVGTCAVTFGPGLDGAYVVYVQGTSGHVVS